MSRPLCGTQASTRAFVASSGPLPSVQNGRCPAPFIVGFTRVEVVEDDPQRQVVDVRYLYGDRIKDRSDGDGAQCVGFNGRRFILAKTGAGIEVVEMTGTGD